MRWVLSAVFLCVTGMLQAQDTLYARNVMDKLCSRKYQGRAYVGKGDRKASAYIASEFRKAGLQKQGSSYFQEFPISVNTITETEVVYNGRKLIPGKDYLIDASSPSVSFSGEISFIPVQALDSAGHYDDRGQKIGTAVLDTFTPLFHEEAAIHLKRYSTDPGKKLVIRLVSDKLVWSSSPRQSKVPVIMLKESVFDRNSKAVFEVRVRSRLLNPHLSRNVVALLPGTRVRDSFIVITAHYDHLGKMGKDALFPGANDNASGVAMMLNLARYYKANPQPYSILFIAFSGEETGLVGSRYFVDHPLIPLSDIRFLINLDLMGNGEEGMMAVNGLIHAREFELLRDLNARGAYLPQVKARGKAMNSDHYWFGQAGVPAFFFYLMGPYPHYHNTDDKASQVPLTGFSEAFLLIRDFITALQKTGDSGH